LLVTVIVADERREFGVPWAIVLEVARITIAFCFHRRGGADNSTPHTSPHGDQLQPLIQGGAIFRWFATKPIAETP
jgi:hypothetical protein